MVYIYYRLCHTYLHNIKFKHFSCHTHRLLESNKIASYFNGCKIIYNTNEIYACHIKSQRCQNA